MPQMFDDVGEIVDEALRRVGKRVVLALPLGIGKPNLIANEFFRRARATRDADARETEVEQAGRRAGPTVRIAVL